MRKSIYLDYAAATPLDPRVKKAMEPYLSEKFYNPSATYLAARKIRQDLENARQATARNLLVKASEITFTAGATEANNLAIQGVMKSKPEAEVLISGVEHDSVYEPSGIFSRKITPVDSRGIIKLDSLKKAISDRTALVSVIFVSHELGATQPLKDISKIVEQVLADRRTRKIRTPLYLHTDASQAANCMSLNLPKLGVDMASLNGGKAYGPKQSGALYVSKNVQLEPLIRGGGQERGLRSGTENVAGAVGFSTALDIAQKGREAEFSRLKILRDDFANLLQKHKIQVVINGPDKHFSPHIISITFPGCDNERLMMELDELGIICAVGSACKAESVLPSRTLSAIGLTDEQARSTLRFSLGRQTTQNDIEHTAVALAKLIGPTNSKA